MVRGDGSEEDMLQLIWGGGVELGIELGVELGMLCAFQHGML